MKKSIFIAAAAMTLAAATACTSKTATNQETTPAEEATVTALTEADLLGKWDVVKIQVAADSVITPAEVDTESPTAIQFFNEDDTYRFSISTNCNIMGGTYSVSGDSIKLGDMYSTRMACPDMRIEDALSQMLPNVTVVTIDNDNAKLEASADSYLELHKAPADQETETADQQ